MALVSVSVASTGLTDLTMPTLGYPQGNTNSPAENSETPNSVKPFLEDPIVKEAMLLLAKKLPENLHYHNLNHTSDVVEHAVAFAERSGLSARDVRLIAIAAAWHDTGFIERRQNNEPIAADLAKVAMERSGCFSKNEIADVVTAILDTQITYETQSGTLVQRAMGRLSPWLLDADLANFGRKDFFEKTLKVYHEINDVKVSSPEELNNEKGIPYLANTVRMLARHTWQTESARDLLQDGKIQNQENLAVLLATMIKSTPESRMNAWQRLLSA